MLPLSDETVGAPVHFGDAATSIDDETYTATLAERVDEMDVLSTDEDEFVESTVSNVPPRPANYEETTATTLGQESPDDATAFEHDPNDCATSDGALAD